MAGKKISQLPPIATPALTDIFAAVQSGTTGQETLQQLLTLLINNISGGTIPALTVTALTTSTIVTGTIAFNPTTGGIIGTATNDNAASGEVGEFISSHILTGSATSITRNTPQNVTNISLTAGDWDVFGNIQLADGAGSATTMAGWTSSTSMTLPDLSLTAIIATITAGAGWAMTVPYQRYSLASTTTVYLSTQVTAPSGTMAVAGGIYARRVR